MDYESAYLLLSKYGQQHVLHYYDKIKDSQRAELLASVERIDFDTLGNVKKAEADKLGNVTVPEAVTLKQVKKMRSRYEEIGLTAIREGRVGAVLLAGGQGTRLGSDLPKGMFNIGETSELTIFECQMNSIKSVCKKAGANIHLFIMTSTRNDIVTREFFEKKDYFGYDKQKIHFFVQGEAPAISFDGKILMEEKYRPVFTPDGNGGWFNAMLSAGMGRILNKNNIEWLNLCGVDNVLQKICDPVFVGATLASGALCGSKVVKKLSPEERVGVLCKEDGIPTVLEYYEMPQKLKIRHEINGELTFAYGVILNYLFNVEKLRAISKRKLVSHLAEKKITCIKGGKKVVPEEPNGYKLEKLAVDQIKLMGSCVGVEVDREKEFAPVKNKEGADSVETARALLKKNGVKL